MRKLIVAHRGATRCLRENTIAAFVKAIEIGADMIEFDVRRTSDGRLVSYHDDNVLHRKISLHTLDQLREVSREAGFDLATVEDILHSSQGRIKLDVELKEQGYEREVVKMLMEHCFPSEFCVTSFQDTSLHAIRSIDRRIRTGLITEIWTPQVVDICSRDYVDLIAPRYCLVSDAQQAGKPLFVWTVDDPVITVAMLSHPSVEAVITNYPDQALRLRGNTTD